MAWPYVEVIWIESECWITTPITSRWHPEFHVFVGNVLLLIIHSGHRAQGSIKHPNDLFKRDREGEDLQMTDDVMEPEHAPCDPHDLAADE